MLQHYSAGYCCCCGCPSYRLTAAAPACSRYRPVAHYLPYATALPSGHVKMLQAAVEAHGKAQGMEGCFELAVGNADKVGQGCSLPPYGSAHSSLYALVCPLMALPTLACMPWYAPGEPGQGQTGERGQRQMQVWRGGYLV